MVEAAFLRVRLFILNILPYAPKTYMGCRTISILLPAERSERRIVIIVATPRIWELRRERDECAK